LWRTVQRDRQILDSAWRRAECGKVTVNEDAKFQIRPLYLQVRDAVLQRIKNGRLKPGGLLPSEMDLHRELGVSLGTLRKALGVLEAEQLIIREPGRGTFVRSHQTGRMLDRFNPMRAADGTPLHGEIKTGTPKLAAPKVWERTALKLEAGDQIVRFDRTRFNAQRPFAYELHCLPDRRFPGLSLRAPLPNELEDLAQAWGVLVARVEGKIRAVPAPPAAAAGLSLPDQAIVLSLERLAFDTDDEPIEVMTAYFDLQDGYCKLEIR
jgi:GntR family transcriptional regulator